MPYEGTFDDFNDRVVQVMSWLNKSRAHDSELA